MRCALAHQRVKNEISYSPRLFEPLVSFKLKEVCLVQYFDRMTEEAESNKLKWHFPCKTEMNDDDFLQKK